MTVFLNKFGFAAELVPRVLLSNSAIFGLISENLSFKGPKLVAGLGISFNNSMCSSK